MRKLLILLSSCMLLVPGLAAAEEFEGNVVAVQSAIVTSSYGGVVQSVAVREGQTVREGDTIAAMQTVKAYAPEDGTICGIFADTGDEVTDAAVLYIAPDNQYTISCTTGKAYNAQENNYVRLGETVYVVYLTNRKYYGFGIVTAVDGSSYTVETTDANLYIGTTVYVYRSEEYASSNRIGSGTVDRVGETAVYGSGSLLKVYVENGEKVTRGQLLFETVAGEMLYSASADGVILADTAGIVETVSVAAGDTVAKDGVLMTVVRPDLYEIEFLIDEELLSSVHIGQEAAISFNWNEETGAVTQGTVSRISYVSESDDGTNTSGTQYKGYISFTADDTVKLGMSVTIKTPD
ncbi:MAG: HlyD family efflux transporter periplasmic adaptor subunit [Clostridiales bacterium]|nr:HlyD family efflux transporter periplasmic adaptor subunit [Clostridiales bacterium]